MDYCGAKNRSGQPCKLPAGWGTNHTGAGRCKLHGGLSPGVPGNKNALKTGLYENICAEFMTPEERALWDDLSTEKLHQLDSDLRLITIRERRMMQRIARLSTVDMTVTEQETETSTTVTGEQIGDAKTTTTKTDSLGQIQAIEEALTKVQAAKARLLELKHKIESDRPPTGTDVGSYVEALEKAAGEVWNGEDGDET